MKPLNLLMIGLVAATHSGFAADATPSATPTKEVAQQQQESPKRGVSITGRVALPKQLPKGLDPSLVDFSRLEGALELAYPAGATDEIQRLLGLPTTGEEISREQVKAQLHKFLSDPDSAKHMQRLLALKEQALQTQPIPLKFDANGEFKVTGVKPGTWWLRVNIPHPTAEGLDYAHFERPLEIKEGAEELSVGELALGVSLVVKVGDFAPDFTGQTLDGKEFKLSGQKGKYVLLDFWATWCAPCIAEIPNLVALRHEIGSEKLAIVGCNLDRSIDDMKAFTTKKPVPYSQVYVGERSESEAATAFGVTRIPSIWLIGPDGKILARDLRGDEIGQAVRRFVQK